jgi:hypothetical protein
MTELYSLELKGYQPASTYSPSSKRFVSEADSKQFVSEAEYWEKYYEYSDSDVVYEWNNGYLEEKLVSDQLTYLTYKWFLKLLDYYLAAHPIAELTGLEMGFRLVLPNAITIRRPDLGVVRHDNSVALLPEDNSYQGTFDICIEAISDSTFQMAQRDMVTKKAEYAQAGVSEYFLLDGHGDRTNFYRLNTKGVYVPIKPVKGIIKSKVLPGFQFRQEDLSVCPSPEDLIQDSVYKSFVLPGYSEAIQQAEQAEQAKQQAEQEKHKRQAAEHQAEQENTRRAHSHFQGHYIESGKESGKKNPNR